MNSFDNTNLPLQSRPTKESYCFLNIHITIVALAFGPGHFEIEITDPAPSLKKISPTYT